MSEEVKEEQMTLGQKPDDEIKGKNKAEEPKKDEDKKAKSEPAKKEAKEEKRYKGQITFVSGPNQTPLNLDIAFAKNKNFQANGGATKAMIKDIAKNVFLELLRPEVDIEIVEHDKQQYCYLTNTLSKKGIGKSYFSNDFSIILQTNAIPFEEIEDYFEYDYEQNKTESRILVYYHQKMNCYLTVIPNEINKSAIHITNSYDYCLNGNPNIYLVADLHSHHKMTNEFSATDDNDERARFGVLFGVFSFSDGWNLREWLWDDPDHKVGKFYNYLGTDNFANYRGRNGAVSFG